MFELARVRLLSVGPKGARYQDVTLDLRGVGAPVVRPVNQPSLFDLDVETPAHADVPRRPSPATVLFLENGGGKSVLIKLVFSVMLPGRRQIVGTTNTRVLENFVLGQDVSHVILEWRHVQTGQAVVTGKVSAWRGGVVSSDPNRFLEAWYSFHPGESLTLDTLPVAEAGRPVLVGGFRDRLDEAQRLDPALRLVWATEHGVWTDHLSGLGLDPELFRYQRQMNADEGEAADAFSLRTDEAFVDWLLRAVTREDEPRQLAEFLDQYAAKLSQREALGAERDFVAGALERLGPLAEAAAAARTARADLDESHARAGALAASLAARHAQEADRHAVLSDRAATAETAERDAEQRARRLGRITAELNRTLAGLRLQEAEAERDAAEALRDERRELVDAWRATEKLLALNRARQDAAALRRVVGAQEDQAAPALAARDAAARRLARGLLAAASVADAEATGYDNRAADLEKEAAAADEARSESDRSAERERERARRAAAQLSAVTAALRAAVSDGLLGSPDDPVRARADEAARAAREASRKVTAAEAEHTRLAELREQLDGEAQDAAAQVADAQSAAGEAARRAAAAERAEAALAGEERLAALLGVEEITADVDAGPLAGLLAAAVEHADGERALLRAESQRDQRLLDALGSGGLLPPAEEVVAARDLLATAGITAWSGWQYLATLPAQRREGVLARHPALVGGLVLNNPDQLGQAEELLAGATLWPRAVLAVGTTEAVVGDTAPPPGDVSFLVPPNPAMFDAERAEQERAALALRQEERNTRITELDLQLATDRDLKVRVRAFADEYPPGTVDALREDRAVTAEALARARDAHAQLRAAVERTVADLRATSGSLPELRGAERTLRARASSLAALADLAASVPGHEAARRAANAAATSHAEDAHAHQDRAARLRRDSAEARRAADDQRRVAAGNREAVRGLAGVGGGDEGPVPDQPVPVLREAYEAATRAYERVAVGEDLRGQLRLADEAEAVALAEVTALRRAVRERAQALLASPDGTDGPARAAAADRAQRALDAAESDHTEAATRAGVLRAEHRRLPPQEITLEPPYARPRTIPEAENVFARAQSDAEAAREAQENARAHREAVHAECAAVERLVTGFAALCTSLKDHQPPELAGVAAYPGGLAEATGLRDEAVARRDDRTSALRAAEAAVRAAADSLARYATEPRFESVVSPPRRQMMNTDRDELPAYAALWESALRPRLTSLTRDLEQIESHRAAIIVRFRGMVDTGLRTLRQAQRLSELPEGLGDWSGEHFLRITFETAEPVLRDERLGAVLDEATAGTTRRGDRRTNGMDLLVRGVRASMAKGVRVEILKPDAVLRGERVRIGNVADVFSGGQLLTAAIMLYCTMAALRANDRGISGRQHAGVLFLDNPIGRASAGYLLELQLAVAEALGVQLIYTTGLFDANALSVFPLVIRLRNDADLRAGLKYLTVDERILPSLSALGPADGGGVLTPARVYARPAPAGERTA